MTTSSGRSGSPCNILLDFMCLSGKTMLSAHCHLEEEQRLSLGVWAEVLRSSHTCRMSLFMVCL